MERSRYFVFIGVCFALTILIFFGCTPTPNPQNKLLAKSTPLIHRELTPFYTPSPGSTLVVKVKTAPSLPPLPTPTQQIYMIKKGDNLGLIANRYGITINALIRENPEVNPNLLMVGSTLIIPSNSQSTQAVGIATPTPVFVKISPINCVKNQDGSGWCFAEVINPGPEAVDSISVLLELIDTKNGIISTQIVSSLLDYVPAGGKIPIVAYIPSPFPTYYQAKLKLLTSLPVPEDDKRYLPIQIKDPKLIISEDGLSAVMKGFIFLDKGSVDVKQVKTSLTAYNNENTIVGARRWEYDQPIRAGDKISVEIPVYSTGEKITRVDIELEANP